MHVTRTQLTAFLPPRGCEVLEEIRRTWDPFTAARIAPHVTVVHELTDDLRDGCGALGSLPPLQLHIGRPRCWGKPEAGTYCEVIDAANGLGRIRSTLGVTEAEGVVFKPHVTLTHPTTTRDPSQAWTAIRTIAVDAAVTVESLHVVEFDGMRWRSVEEVRLEGA
jgi:hypothetical protein